MGFTGITLLLMHLYTPPFSNDRDGAHPWPGSGVFTQCQGDLQLRLGGFAVGPDSVEGPGVGQNNPVPSRSDKGQPQSDPPLLGGSYHLDPL